MTNIDYVADAICEALASWIAEPLHRMAYEDAARAALIAAGVVVISSEEWAKLTGILDNPPLPTEALKELLKSHQRDDP